MGELCLLLALAAGCAPAGGPGPGFTEAVLLLSGASAIEELDEQELERYQHLADHPLDLNSAGMGRLMASGLLSRYQAASLLDYKESSGDILSYTELGLVDGFGPERAEALKHFTVLRSKGAPGQAMDRKVGQTFLARASVREKDGITPAGGLKYSLEIGDAAEFNWASRTTYSSTAVTPGCASAAYHGKRAVSIVAGDYHARFGQGLVLWSGFSMSGVPSVASFRKNGTGIGASASFTRQMFGAATSLDLGRWNVSAGWSWPGTALGNITRHGRIATVGASAVFDRAGGRGTAGLDFKFGLPGISLFGEAAIESGAGGPSPAGIAGIIWTPRYGTKLAMLARYYSPGFSGVGAGAARASTKVSDEAALSLGFENRMVSTTLDIARKPTKGTSRIKSISTFALPLALSGRELHREQTGQQDGDSTALHLKPMARLAISAKPDSPVRVDLRGEMRASLRSMRLNARYNALWCNGFAWLWYAEGGIERGGFTGFLRFTLFKVDDWDDRIYVYERDVPGAFSIPAYYGRGFTLAAVSGLKPESRGRCRHRLNLKLSTTVYPWTEPAKSGSAEIRIQYMISL